MDGWRPLQLPSLASATRDYAQAIEAARFDRLDDRDLTRLYAAMGADLWSWQRARRLTGQQPWRASPNQPERFERARAVRQMVGDIPTWERVLVELDANIRRALQSGRPAPPPLEIPAAVTLMIEVRRAAALEKLARRQRGADGDGGGPVPCPDETVHHPPTPTRPA